ncbi:MAG: TM2 domain-containing protein [Gemmatirosa sp.]
MDTYAPLPTTKYCQSCANLLDVHASLCPRCGVPQPRVAIGPDSEKRLLIAFVLCFLVGPLGLHRFYVGKTGTGILMILTLGGLGIWVLVDLIMLVTGNFRDADGQRLTEWSV